MHSSLDAALFSLIRCPDKRTLPVVLSRAQIKALFSAVKEERFRVILKLIYVCGLRVTEAVNLRPCDIVENGTLIRLSHHTKNNTHRLVPLPKAMVQELRKYWATHRHPDLLFPGLGRAWKDAPLSEAKTPMSVGSVQLCMRLLRAAAGLPDTCTVHTLRHSYATHMLERGVSVRLISAYLGHLHLETTMIYLHMTAVSEAKARAAADELCE
ncbi:tyrosine-type recombinase/integrase [Nibricoccus sp. IMCC34717]|uniref:tyrosine-type recombinase/integrase n=1 Tax=Nibricoccus sp. IMCC34717 TaxID=3034021 RepID=UPI00384E1B91